MIKNILGLFAFVIDEEVIEVVEFMIVPEVCEFDGRPDIEESTVVVVVVIFVIFGVGRETEPYGPFIQEKVVGYHTYC